MHRSLTALLLAGITSAGLAQKVPRRPKLPAAADTNDAAAYFEWGRMSLKKDPDQAAAAFYWAMRIDPALADAYYGRRTALLVANPRRLVQYNRGSRNVVQSAEMQGLDSLLSQALMLNPMLPMRFDRLLTMTALTQIVESEGGPPLTSGEQAELEWIFDRYLRGDVDGAELRARMAQSDGQYDAALTEYASAIRGAGKKAELRAARGRLFLQIGKADSALVELGLALEELRKRDKKDFVVFYNSKAMLETTVGIANQQLGNDAAARDAFGRALQEDLSYYPAHVRLAYLALDKRDTAQALTEMDLATQLRPANGLLRDQYGYALLTAGRTADAVTQFKKAAELEPFYALPRRHLAEASEKAGDRAAALAAYRSFLAIAPRNDLQRAAVTERVASLAGNP